jgi:hypothetical protein
LLVGDLFGVTVCTGAVDAICQRASDALAGRHRQLLDWVLNQGAVRVDETVWRTRGDARALWTPTTPEARFLQIAEHCNRGQFQALIGPFRGSWPRIAANRFCAPGPAPAPGVLVTLCRRRHKSHIQRDFRRHADGLAEQKPFGEQGLELTGRLFAAWRSYQHQHHDRDRLKGEIAPIQIELRKLLEDASPNSTRTRWHWRFANNLLKVWPALWTFVAVEDVEPTNNPAERALHAPVIHRKVSLGTQTKHGERFAQRALSAPPPAASKAARCSPNPSHPANHRPHSRRSLPALA